MTVEGSDWAKGLEARSRALVSEGHQAEQCYAEAIERLGRTQLRPDLARAHLLYGEWLRRENRRIDARHQLRAAYDLLDAIGAGAFAERTRRELLATGEKVRKREVDTHSQLTPQEYASLGWPGTDAPTPRSPRNYSSAPAPSNGTCARCSPNWASPPAGISRTLFSREASKRRFPPPPPPPFPPPLFFLYSNQASARARRT